MFYMSPDLYLSYFVGTLRPIAAKTEVPKPFRKTTGPTTRATIGPIVRLIA
jgi:hypothetical protein